jgi:hypothetical protein
MNANLEKNAAAIISAIDALDQAAKTAPTIDTMVFFAAVQTSVVAYMRTMISQAKEYKRELDNLN